jgi:two-component system phosphate regulon response regulator PhoB
VTSILIAEDEADLREMLTESLQAAGYTVHATGTVNEARRLLERYKPDLLLLDWMLPDTSGLNWLRQLRRIDRFRSLPVIMLTARGEVSDRVAGLDCGADDYIVKPFSLKELQARVRAQLRNQQPAAPEGRLELAGLVLDSVTHRVTADGEEIHLGPTEFRLLRHFMSRPERVYSRSELLDRVWGHQVFIEERTVDVHILRLRKALEPVGMSDLVQTVRGIGYRFSPRGT